MAAVVKTMNMLFHPDLTLVTRARIIWLRQRMMSSRISTAWGEVVRGGAGKGNGSGAELPVRKFGQSIGRMRWHELADLNSLAGVDGVVEWTNG